LDRAERDRNGVLVELEHACTRSTEEQERLFAQVEEVTRAWKVAVGDRGEAMQEAASAKLDLELAQSNWAREKRELQAAVEEQRAKLLQTQTQTREVASLSRAQIGDVSNKLKRSIQREEERVDELSRVRIDADMWKRRAETAEKRLDALQGQMAAIRRR
jgi:hypothetical protein